MRLDHFEFHEKIRRALETQREQFASSLFRGCLELTFCHTEKDVEWSKITVKEIDRKLKMSDEKSEMKQPQRKAVE